MKVKKKLFVNVCGRSAGKPKKGTRIMTNQRLPLFASKNKEEKGGVLKAVKAVAEHTQKFCTALHHAENQRSLRNRSKLFFRTFDRRRLRNSSIV